MHIVRGANAKARGIPADIRIEDSTNTLMPDKTTPFPDYGFRVDWAKLNNELFGAIYADPELRARYDRADSHQAQLICSDLFDILVKDASEFVERFIILTER